MEQIKRSTRWILVSCLLLFAGGGCTTIDYVTGKETRNMYNINDEIGMGRQVLQSYNQTMISNNVPINGNTAKMRELQDITRRIAAVSHAPSLPYEVVLYQTNIVNAMAAPGGKLMVFEGLWDEKEGLVHDKDELAAVMAHEIAHVNCRHSTEAMTRALPGQLVLMGAAMFAETQDNDDMRAGVLAAFLLYNGLWVPYYSRRDELEADRVGMMYMAKAGYDPEAAVRIWQRVDQHEGSMPALSIFSTHPSHGTRHLELRKHLPAAKQAYYQAIKTKGPKPSATPHKSSTRFR